jgi:CBS domain-containing protein
MDASVPMTRDVIVVPPTLSLLAAFAVMERERIRHLPVVQGGALLGILSDRDVLARATLRDNGSLEVPRDPVALALR